MLDVVKPADPNEIGVVEFIPISEVKTDADVTGLAWLAPTVPLCTSNALIFVDNSLFKRPR